MFCSPVYHQTPSSLPTSASLFSTTTSSMPLSIPTTVERPPSSTKRARNPEPSDDAYLASAFNKRLRLDPSAPIITSQWGTGDVAQTDLSSQSAPIDGSYPALTPAWGGAIWRVNSEERESDVDMSERQDSKTSDSDISVELTAQGKEALASRRDAQPRRLLQRGLSYDFPGPHPPLHLPPDMCQIVPYIPPPSDAISPRPPHTSITIEDVTDLERTNSEDRGVPGSNIGDITMVDFRCEPIVEEPREIAMD